MDNHKEEFLKFSIEKNVLQLGKFTTKFGRKSPYFFNAGLFSDGESLIKLAKFYSQIIINNKIEFDILFGSAYKGIVLSAITVLSLAQKGINKSFAYNRKEAKDHGEGGIFIGEKLKGKKILIIDDVISAGTSIKEVLQIIKKEKAIPIAVLIALDRMEKGSAEISAKQEIEKNYNIPIYCIANLNDLLNLIKNTPKLQKYQKEIELYKNKYVVY